MKGMKGDFKISLPFYKKRCILVKLLHKKAHNILFRIVHLAGT